MKRLLIIFDVTNKILINQIKQMLNTMTKKVISIVAVLILSAIGMIVGYLVCNEILDLFLSGDGRSIYFLLLSESVTVSSISFALFVLLQFISTDSSSFSTILKWLPVKQFERKLSQILPFYINITSCTMLFVVLLFLPSMFVRAISLQLIGSFVICLLLQTVFCIIMLTSICSIVHFILSKIHIPFSKSIAVTITVLISLIFLVKFMFSFPSYLAEYEIFEYNPLTLSIPVYLLLYNWQLNIDINYWVFVVEMIALSLAFFVSIIIQNSVKENAALKILEFIQFPHSKFFSLVCKEVKIHFRNEENFLHLLVLILGSVILRFKFQCTTESLTVCVCVAMLSTFPTLCSFGMEEHLLPLYKQMGVKSSTFTLSKLLGCTLSTFIIYILISAIMLTFIDIFNILIGFFVMIGINIVLYFIGVLIPTNAENSYMQGLTIFVLILVTFPAYYGLNYVMTYSRVASFTIAITIIVTLFLLTFKVTAAKWKT